MRWLWQAAYNGNAESYAVIGDLLAKGEIIKKQLERVRPLYQRALTGGAGYGAFCLGIDYCSGKCGPQDVDKGLRYLRQAADMGEDGAAEVADGIMRAMLEAAEEDE